MDKKIDKMMERIAGGRGDRDDPKKAHLLLKMLQYIYYHLIRVEFKDGLVWHIPVSLFLRTPQRIKFYKSLEVGSRKRDNTYFSCPLCRKPSFYDSPCKRDCKKKMPEVYWRNLWNEFQRKGRFLEMIDRGQVPENVKRVVYVQSAPRKS